MSLSNSNGEAASFDLDALGWTSGRAAGFEPYRAQGLVPARVAAAHRDVYRVWSESGESLAEVSGRLRHAAVDHASLPATGDWVALRLPPGDGRAVVDAVLPRQSCFSRKTAGERTQEQVVAANVDTVFLLAGLDGDFKLRRLERTLVLAWDSGASPVIVLTKADLCPETALRRDEVEAIAPGVPVFAVSSLLGEGLDALAPFVAPGRTVALLGSSGVGKSTLLNRLLGWDRQATRAVRAHDSRGRHTTTFRELVRLPGGGLIIDTPGLRELQLWVDDAEMALSGTFEDIDSLAARCAFRDCRHAQEPGCAVRQALDDGTLDAARFGSFLKLQKELRHLERRQDLFAQLAEKRRWRAIHRAARHRRPRE
jgi:ribosome biogenesis GTPase